jgi:hypothetical protein
MSEQKDNHSAPEAPLRKRCRIEECHADDWWRERSLPQKILIGIGFGVLGLALVFFFGWVVMTLWNWLMPDLFGLKKLTYWQAWGLFILAKILFGGCGSGGGNGRKDRKRKRHLRRAMQQSQAAEEA